METRFDFYRILLPGALALALVDAVIRVVGASGNAESQAESDAILAFIEDPLRGAVVAFGMGVALYFIEPGNSAPQYYNNIPSTRLHSRLQREGLSTRGALSLFFRAQDELMPDPLRERALLYGAFYRVGFQAILLTLLAGALAPALVLGVVESPMAPWRFLDGAGRTSLIITVAIALVLTAFPFFRAKRRGADKPTLRSLLYLALAIPSWLGWLNFHHRWLDLAWLPPRLAVYIGLAVSLLAWSILRLRGPFRPFWRFIRKGGAHPDKPHRDDQIAMLDLSIASVTLVGTSSMASMLSDGQILAIFGLVVLGLVLSMTKKHERRLSGIYMNQGQWIDDNFHAIIKLAGMSVVPRPDAPAVQDGHSPSAHSPSAQGGQKPRDDADAEKGDT